MKVRKFVPKDLKRVFEIENMSFDQSYGINMFQQLYEMGIGFLVAEKDDYVVGYVMLIKTIAVRELEQNCSYVQFLFYQCFRLMQSILRLEKVMLVRLSFMKGSIS